MDRDGVLNERISDGYVTDPAQVVLLEAMMPALLLATNQGMSLVIVTNQGMIGRRLATEFDLLRVHARLLEGLQERGLSVEAIYACEHHPLAVDPTDRTCLCRKPLPGLILASAADLRIDLAASIMIGDQASDRRAAVAAGIPRGRVAIVDPASVPMRTLTSQIQAALRASY